MFRRVLYFLRELLAEWAYGLTLPFRAFGPHVLRSEITRDARAALTGGGDVFRAARVGLWTVGVFFVRLPRLIVAFPVAVWWFLRTRHPIHQRRLRHPPRRPRRRPQPPRLPAARLGHGLGHRPRRRPLLRPPVPRPWRRGTPLRPDRVHHPAALAARSQRRGARLRRGRPPATGRVLPV